MKRTTILTITVLGLAVTAAASPKDDAKLRFQQSATRAIANFHVANNLEERLQAQGLTSQPATVALRLRIEAALDRAEAALAQGDVDAVQEAVTRIDGMLDHFARTVGGY